MSPTVSPAVSPTVVDIDRIDCDLSVAQVSLAMARRSHARCPSAENEARVDEAVAAVDRLLDERLAARG